MALSYRYVALTDTGLRRSDNQDSGYASPRILAIADGMGGAAAGDLASATTMQEIRKLDVDDSWVESDDPMGALAGAVSRANLALADLIHADPAVEGMGTTLEALLWDGERFAWAHIGDSRAYRLRDGELEQISDDHTFVQSLVDEGRISPDEARVHPHRSLILRALLGRDDNDPDLSWIEPRVGDRYLLCSDGLSDMVDDATIEMLLSAESIDVAATELVRTALERGGYDNVTVVIGEVVDDSTPVVEELSSADGRPQLVGAATREARPRTGQAGGTAATPVATSSAAAAPDEDVDPEELRYAPRPSGGRRRLRWFLGVVMVLAVLGAAGVLTYQWTQRQYFVSEQDGQVTIFRGVQADVPGLTLEHVEKVTDVSIDSLSSYSRRQVSNGIEASSLADAEEIVANLDAATPTTPTPSTPTPSKKPSKTPTTKPTTSALGLPRPAGAVA